MKRSLLFTIILLFPLYFGYSQEQVPAVEWAEPFNEGNFYGTTFSIAGGSSDLFTSIKTREAGKGLVWISKFTSEGHIKTQYVQDEFNSNLATPIVLSYPSKDGGVLVSYNAGKLLRKYNVALDLSWSKKVNYDMLKACSTLSGGFYLLTTNTSSLTGKTTADIKRMTGDGIIEWGIDVSSFWSSNFDILTSGDDGLIISTANGIRKYSSVGSLVWSNSFIMNGNKFTYANSHLMYLQTNNSSSKTNNLVQLNTDNGQINWEKSFTDDPIRDFEKTPDCGFVLSTKTGLYKYDSTGTLQWENTNYLSAKIAVTDNQKIFVINSKNASIVKLNMNNEIVWSKFFNGYNFYLQDIVGASDDGLYVVAENLQNTGFAGLEYFVFKLASPITPCKSIFDITGESIVACKTGKLTMSSKVTNSKLDDLGKLTDFSFQWNKNNLPISSAITPTYSTTQSGVYNLTLKQQGCVYSSREVTLKIVNGSPPVVKTSKEQICAGLPVYLTATGCEGTVIWSTGQKGSQINITPQISTTYTAVCESNINNQVCQSAPSLGVNVKVLSKSDLVIQNISGNKEFCENEATNLKPTTSGGQPPFSYIWKKNGNDFSKETNLSTGEEGIYFLSITDNTGCVLNSDTIIIKKSISPTAPLLTTLNSQICVGGSTIITTSSKESAYQWLMNNTEISAATGQSYAATSAGDYRLKITNANGCSTSSTNSITISEIVIPQPTIKQSNDSLISSAASGNKWYFNSNEMSFTSQKIKFTELGSYQVKVFDKGCESLISAVFQPSLLANEEEKFYLQLYPNPTTDKVYLKSVKLFTYKLVDVTGRLVGYTAVKQNAHTIDFSGFNSGNYFIVLEEENGNIMVKKVNVSR